MIETDRLLALIKRKPGLTQRELAEAMFGDYADSRQIIDDIKTLLTIRFIERRGDGGRHYPYRYHRTERG